MDRNKTATKLAPGRRVRLVARWGRDLVHPDRQWLDQPVRDEPCRAGASAHLPARRFQPVRHFSRGPGALRARLRAMGGPRALPRRGARAGYKWLDATVPLDLSADGRLLLFAEKEPGWGSATELRPQDGRLRRRAAGRGVLLALSPDGKWALCPPGVLRAEHSVAVRHRAEARSLPSDGLEYPGAFGFDWLPDGEAFLFTAKQPGHPERIFVQSVKGSSAGAGHSGGRPDRFGLRRRSRRTGSSWSASGTASPRSIPSRGETHFPSRAPAGGSADSVERRR